MGPPELSIPRDVFAPEVLDEPISHTPLDPNITGPEPSAEEIRAMIEAMGQHAPAIEEPVRQIRQRPEKSKGKIGQFLEQHHLLILLKMGLAPLTFWSLFGALKSSKGGQH
jgi:hypothetical protein